MGLGPVGPGVGYQGPERGEAPPPSLLVFMSLWALFPLSDCGLGPRRWSEPGNQKMLGDPNPEQEPEPAPDTVDTIVLSLCGGLADSRDISLGMSDHEPF